MGEPVEPNVDINGDHECTVRAWNFIGGRVMPANSIAILAIAQIVKSLFGSLVYISTIYLS